VTSAVDEFGGMLHFGCQEQASTNPNHTNPKKRKDDVIIRTGDETGAAAIESMAARVDIPRFVPYIAYYVIN
jgi:hypothetical protein